MVRVLLGGPACMSAVQETTAGPLLATAGPLLGHCWATADPLPYGFLMGEAALIRRGVQKNDVISTKDVKYHHDFTSWCRCCFEGPSFLFFRSWSIFFSQND